MPPAGEKRRREADAVGDNDACAAYKRRMARYLEHVQNDLTADRMPLVNNLGKLFAEASEDAVEFKASQQAFLACIRPALVLSFDRNDYVEAYLDFCAQAAVAIDAKLFDKEGWPTLVRSVTRFVKKYHKYADASMRLRCVQLVSKLHSYWRKQYESEPEYEPYDGWQWDITHVLTQRVIDKKPRTRKQAIRALADLQCEEKEVHHCHVTKVLTWLISADKSPDARVAAIETLAPSHHVLPDVIARTRDVSVKVRAAAYMWLANKVSLRSFTIMQRVDLLTTAFADRDPRVSRVVEEELLTEWYKTAKKAADKGGKREPDADAAADCVTFTDVCLELLNRFALPQGEQVLEKMLGAMILCQWRTNDAVSQLAQQFNLLNGNRVMKHSLTAYFRHTDAEAQWSHRLLAYNRVFYWRVTAATVRAYCGRDGVQHGDALWQTCAELLLPTVRELCDYIKEYASTCRSLPTRQADDFVTRQLLLLLPMCDTDDNSSRSYYREHLEWIFTQPGVSAEIMDTVVSQYIPILVKQQPSKEAALAEARKKLLDFVSDLLSEGGAGDDTTVDGTRMNFTQEAENTQARLYEERNKVLDMDVSLVTKMLAIADAFLRRNMFTCVDAKLRTVFDNLLLPCVTHSDPSARNLALSSVGLCVVLHKPYAKMYTALLASGVAHEVHEPRIQTTCVARLCDALAMWPPMRLAQCMYKADESVTDPLHHFLNAVATLMERTKDASLACTCVDGLAGLLAKGRISSVDVLSRIVVAWFNPANANNARLRATLATFLPYFALQSRANRLLLSDAMMPALHKVVSAPEKSPPKDIDLYNMASFVMSICKEDTATQGDTAADTAEAPHVRIGNVLLDHLSNCMAVGETTNALIRVYSRLTTLLQPATDADARSTLLAKLDHVMAAMDELGEYKLCTKQLLKARSQLGGATAPLRKRNDEDDSGQSDTELDDATTAPVATLAAAGVDTEQSSIMSDAND